MSLRGGQIAEESYRVSVTWQYCGKILSTINQHLPIQDPRRTTDWKSYTHSNIISHRFGMFNLFTLSSMLQEEAKLYPRTKTLFFEHIPAAKKCSILWHQRCENTVGFEKWQLKDMIIANRGKESLVKRNLGTGNMHWTALCLRERHRDNLRFQILYTGPLEHFSFGTYFLFPRIYIVLRNLFL